VSLQSPIIPFLRTWAEPAIGAAQSVECAALVGFEARFKCTEPRVPGRVDDAQEVGIKACRIPFRRARILVLKNKTRVRQAVVEPADENVPLFDRSSSFVRAIQTVVVVLGVIPMAPSKSMSPSRAPRLAVAC
jgi:hypothetical protein